MLRSLKIDNFALIDGQHIPFVKGLTVITGETGAGKSIMLDALALVLGDRADLSVVRFPEKKCVVEAEFLISSYGLEDFFSENDLDYQEETLIRRELLPGGKSRAFVNDTPVVLQVLKELGDRLIDIHNQHQTRSLIYPNQQLELVDSFHGDKGLLNRYQSVYKALNRTRQQLSDLKKAAEQRSREIDFIQFQYQELEQAQLADPDELTNLEGELNTLIHLESIKQATDLCGQLLEESDINIIDLLNQAKSALSKVAAYDGELSKAHDALVTLQIELKELNRGLVKHVDAIQIDEERLELLKQRVDQLQGLLSKYRLQTLADLIQERNRLHEALNHADEQGEQIQKLEADRIQLEREALALAGELSVLRSECRSNIEDQVNRMLNYLGMPHAQLKIEMNSSKELNNNGLDSIQFHVKTNAGGSFAPIDKVASGGELSRIMLCLKAVNARKQSLPTLIFDEIDTGVSGEVASKMGDVLRDLGKHGQVISISHLPQIAGKGDQQLKVVKEVVDGVTTSKVIELNKTERINELAAMLSGSEVTQAARVHAESLLSETPTVDFGG
ncbi:MAG TPA: DNA repair protein RecN [Luteibaculaceae bacterium]|nr:DNA repair protein RecN [Luteibaculaceae bacterium]